MAAAARSPDRRRRLLCVYQHAPTPGAPGIYRHRLYLAELARRGWQVDLVSTAVNYMTGTVPPRYARRPYVSETIDGIRHHWVWASRGIHASRTRRAANYATFAVAAALRAATLPRPDVVLVSSPPLTVGALGPMLGARASGRWVLEVRDVWPESAAAVGWLSEQSLAYRALDRLARRLASRAASVVVPSPGLVPLVRGHGAERVVLVPGSVVDAGPEAERARERVRSELGVEEESCLFVYVGSIGVANGLGLLVDAVRLLPSDASAAFVLVGDGSARDDLERRLVNERNGRIRLLGPVRRERVTELLGASDVCLHLLRPDPVFSTALPTKVLEYFGAHRPFVTTVRGLPERLAKESGGGFGGTAAELASELLRWIDMAPAERRERGEQSFRYGSQAFAFADAVDVLEAALVEASAGSPRHRNRSVPSGETEAPAEPRG